MNYAEMNYNICPSCKERGIPRGENGQVFACQSCQCVVEYIGRSTSEYISGQSIEILIKKEQSSYNKHQQLQTFLDSLTEDELGFVTGYAHTKLDTLKKK